MPRKDEIMFRPSFSINESKVLLRLVLTVKTDPEDFESAIVKERLRQSLLRFLAVNGGLVLGGGSGEDLHHLQSTVMQPQRIQSKSGEVPSMDEFEAIMNSIPDSTN